MDVNINGAKILATYENVPLLGTVHITQTLVVSGLIFVVIAALAVWLGSWLKGLTHAQVATQSPSASLAVTRHSVVGVSSVATSLPSSSLSSTADPRYIIGST